MKRLLFVLAVGLVGYAWKGNLHGFAPPPAPDPAEAMVARLAERLGGQGGSAAEWAMLGRSYAVLDQAADAMAAYRSALRLETRADWLAELADLLASQQGGRFDAEAAGLVDQALALDPQHLKSLGLAANRDWQAGRHAAARSHWQALLAHAPAEHPLRALAEQGLQQALP